MGYRDLQECVTDLEQTEQLIRVDECVDPNLEMGAIQRRVFRAQGPALLFTNVKGCKFDVLGNLFGTIDRACFLFRDTLVAVRRLIDLKLYPSEALKHPFRYRQIPRVLLNARPKKVKTGLVLKNECPLSDLPQIKSWPRDGGAFITLPQVYTENVEKEDWSKSNLGMYRIQISGGQYLPNQEIGLHYQSHRHIGVHHEAAIRKGKPFKVNIFVGGAPAMTLAAVMPMPEGMPELSFAGALGGRRVPMIVNKEKMPIYAEADFCITGTVIPDKLLPEGPFGDHLGYYSLVHGYPVLKVEHVYHRDNAIWPFTTVGRPPEEDTIFGQLIHELTEPLIPDVLPGVHQVHAVDAAGVHPLLLAIGSERYTPYAKTKRPQEILTQANALLGQGQLSLAKYLMICDRNDDLELDVHNIADFFYHILERVDFSRDLHFQTNTTIDTLDYTGTGFNEGSKLIIAAVGEKKRELPTHLPSLLNFPEGFSDPRVCLPGVVAVNGPPTENDNKAKDAEIRAFCFMMKNQHQLQDFPLIIIVDDSEFTARNIDNFLWVTFTRSNPSHDIYGVDSFIEYKHWGCQGSLVIDARTKPHHAPPLEDDPEIEKRVDALGAPGKPLHGII